MQLSSASCHFLTVKRMWD